MEPEGLLYAKTHEWVRLETDPQGATVATVGLSAFALEQLTDLVYLALPEVGRRVTAGEPMAEIESVKAVSDVYSPVDGEDVEVNTGATDRPETLSEDPYDAGWLVRIKTSSDAGRGNLLDCAAYRKQCDEETASRE